ncbi:MAG TPA: CvpA family protein, partial [Pedococcus sp.]
MFLGLTVLDWLLVLLFVSYAVTGWRQGLVVSVLSLAGFLGGGALAMWLLPKAIHDWTNLETSPLMRTVILIAGVFVVASIGQALAVQVGGRLRSRLRVRPAQALDAAAGAVAVVVSAAVLVWFIAGALRGGAPAPIAKAIGESRVLRTIDDVVPPQTSRLFAGFREVLDREGFPRVFEGIGTERIAPVTPPDQGVVESAGVREAAASVIKVTGVATSCNRGQEGS